MSLPVSSIFLFAGTDFPSFPDFSGFLWAIGGDSSSFSLFGGTESSTSSTINRKSINIASCFSETLKHRIVS